MVKSLVKVKCCVVCLVTAVTSTAASAQNHNPGNGTPDPQRQLVRTASEAPRAEHSERRDDPTLGPIDVVTIRLNNTGVSSAKYLNARNPALIWASRPAVPAAFRLQFANDTAGTEIKVTLPAVAVPFVPATATAPAFLPLSLLGMDAPTMGRESRRMVNVALGLADAAVMHAPEELTYTPADGVIWCLAGFALRETRALDAALSGPVTETTTTRVLTTQILSPSTAAVAPGACAVTSVQEARAALETFRTVHGRRAEARPATSVAAALDALEHAATAMEEHARLIQAGGSAAGSSTPKARAQALFGVVLDKCEAKDTAVFCVPSLNLGISNATGWIDGRILAAYPRRTAIKFAVTFPFALESEQPSNASGFFSMDDELLPTPNATTFAATGSLALAHDPFLGPPGTFVTPAWIDEGKGTLQLRSTARAAMNYSLGDRATAMFELQVKNGAHGSKEQELAATANQYHFQLFGFGGGSLKFGKYLFAKPTDGLAINESGEGFTARLQAFSVSHIVKRESEHGVADADDHDHTVWLADYTNQAIRQFGGLRSFSAYALHGREDLPGHERRYYTLGGEAHALFPKDFASGTFAYYRSWSGPTGGNSAARDAEGSAWLARVSRSWFAESKVTRTLAATLARGSADERDGRDRYEGYLGENAAFAPDGSLFISGVVPRLRLEEETSTHGFTDRGLSGRRVVTLLMADHTWSLLEVIAGWLTVPERDVESRHTTVRLHYYWPSDRVAPSRAGTWEAQLEFLLESPKGIKTIVKGSWVSHVLTNGPLRQVFGKSGPLSLLIQTNISIK